MNPWCCYVNVEVSFVTPAYTDLALVKCCGSINDDNDYTSHPCFMISVAFTTGIKKFMEEDLEPKLTTYIQGSRLLGVAMVFREYQLAVLEEDRSIEEAAIAFLPKTWTFKDDALKKQRSKVTRTKFVFSIIHFCVLALVTQ